MYWYVLVWEVQCIGSVVVVGIGEGLQVDVCWCDVFDLFDQCIEVVCLLCWVCVVDIIQVDLQGMDVIECDIVVQFVGQFFYGWVVVDQEVCQVMQVVGYWCVVVFQIEGYWYVQLFGDVVV